MKSAIVMAVLAALAVCSDAAAVEANPRYMLIQGYPQPEDTLLYSQTFIKTPVANQVQFEEIVYEGNVRITAIRATQVGEEQRSVPSVRYGGVGRNFVTIRLTSAPGFGYHYNVQIWGR